jgi:hypothetical protein
MQVEVVVQVISRLLPDLVARVVVVLVFSTVPLPWMAQVELVVGQGAMAQMV